MSHDAIVIGTGPAGVSAAFPLVEAGLKVLMLDAAVTSAEILPPAGEYLNLRATDRHQWDWMVGRDLRALKHSDATSPKLRVPSLAATFDHFAEENRIRTTDFAAVGSLSTGGLSNAWGAGAARFDAAELRNFPIPVDELHHGYDIVSRRVGLSGSNNDDLTDYFGVDEWADPALDLDPNCERILDRYNRRRRTGWDVGARIGRSRLAVLIKDRSERQGCNRSGLCLWGCRRNAIYSARYDLDTLKTRPNVTHISGFVAQDLSRDGSDWLVKGRDRHTKGHVQYRAKAVVLAAGTIATTAIALRSLKLTGHPLRLLSSPTAAFLLLLPERLGRKAASGHNLAQLSVSFPDVSEFGNIHCALFPATHIPAFEFLQHFPLSRALAADAWRAIAPAAIIGNCFLPGDHSRHTIELVADGSISIHGCAAPGLAETLDNLRHALARTFRSLGAIMPPGGFVAGKLGSDIHYAGTLPMSTNPSGASTSPDCEVTGLPGVFVADAASFVSLPAKPHTLTLMANAHRVGTKVMQRLRSNAGVA
jgi:choline dehydrogenase-like flavoprotein